MLENNLRLTLSKVAALLNQNKVEYLVIGGVAVSVYGYYRVSGVTLGQPEIKHDIDFWYNPTTQNFHRLLEALRGLDLDSEDWDRLVFNRKNYLRITQSDYRLEFLPQMKGLESFEKSLQNAKNISLDGNTLNIIGYGDLVKNKETVDRQIDRQDLKELKKKNP